MTSTPASTIISVHVQPRARSSEVVGFQGDAIKVRLRSPPVDGAANDELIQLFANLLHINRRNIQIVGGPSSRRKRLRVNGLARDDILSTLGLPR